jgi:DNA-binding NarL/FixJ family response regulator
VVNGTDGVAKVRVFVVDDHTVVRSGVRLEVGDVVDVVGEAADVRSAIEGIRALAPDVVLLDVHLPDALGFDLAVAARSSTRSCRRRRRSASLRCRCPTRRRTCWT